MKLNALVFVALVLVGCDDSSPKQEPEAHRRNDLERLDSAQLNPITLDELTAVFAPFSEFTDLQRESTLRRTAGTAVQWSLPVYEISPPVGGVYKVLTETRSSAGGPTDRLLVVVFITPRGDSDRQTLESLRTGHTISFRGIISDIPLRAAVQIAPAMLVATAGSVGTNAAKSSVSVPSAETAHSTVEVAPASNVTALVEEPAGSPPPTDTERRKDDSGVAQDRVPAADPPSAAPPAPTP